MYGSSDTHYQAGANYTICIYSWQSIFTGMFSMGYLSAEEQEK